jgi:hypothetical protein
MPAVVMGTSPRRLGRTHRCHVHGVRVPMVKMFDKQLTIRMAEDSMLGAATGAAATAAMSLPMVAARRAGVIPELPPQDITDDILERTGVGPGRAGRRSLGWGSHLAFGMAAGAGFGILRDILRPRLPDPVTGVVFGLSVWAVSYMGWVPALGILPPPTQDRPGRPVTMLIAHVVFGLVLGTLMGRLRPARS